MQVGTVCVSIGDGQVSGFNGIVPGNTMYLSTWVTQCNAAQTACSIVPGTTVIFTGPSGGNRPPY